MNVWIMFGILKLKPCLSSLVRNIDMILNIVKQSMQVAGTCLTCKAHLPQRRLS